MPVCCVANCSHNPYRDKQYKFYSFPWKSYETERRGRWITAVRRSMPNGSQWMPKQQRTIICSVHFVGGKKSEDMHSPSYVPSIFPAVYKRKLPPVSSAARYERLKARKSSPQHQCAQQQEFSTDQGEPVVVSITIDGELPTLEPNESQDDLGNNVGTQVNTGPIKVSVGTQTDITVHPKLEGPAITSADKIYEDTKPNNDNFKMECKGFHGFKSIKTETQIVDITGITIFIFAQLLNLLPAPKNNDKFNNKDKLLIFLMKMKLGITSSALAVFFGCTRPTISRVFKNVLDILYEHRKSFVFWPDKFTVMSSLPNAFKEKYRNCRVIMDCTEFRVQQPHEIYKRVHLFSHNKQTFTFKVLIGITPSGFICLVSKCCGGRTSDTQITLNSELLSKLEPGDMVMADKGFPGIKTALGDEKVVTVMPPFCHEGTLTENELEETYSLASVRTHVERAIQRIKVFNILKDIPVDLFNDIDRIVNVAAMLTNLNKPLMSNESLMSI